MISQRHTFEIEFHGNINCFIFFLRLISCIRHNTHHLHTHINLSHQASSFQLISFWIFIIAIHGND